MSVFVGVVGGELDSDTTLSSDSNRRGLLALDFFFFLFFAASARLLSRSLLKLAVKFGDPLGVEILSSSASWFRYFKPYREGVGVLALCMALPPSNLDRLDVIANGLMADLRFRGVVDVELDPLPVRAEILSMLLATPCLPNMSCVDLLFPAEDFFGDLLLDDLRTCINIEEEALCRREGLGARKDCVC